MQETQVADLVQTLRDLAYIVRESNGQAHFLMTSEMAFQEAADEIERLQVKVAQWREVANAYERGAMGEGDRLFKEACLD